MDQNDWEVRAAFPEYIDLQEDHGEEYQQYLDNCLDNFKQLIKKYQDEKGIIIQIENKLCVVMHQTPSTYVISLYEGLLTTHFAQKKQPKLSRFYDTDDLPQLPLLNQYLDGKLDVLPWPIIGSFESTVQEALIRLYNHNYGRIAIHEIFLLWFPSLLTPYVNLLEHLFNGPIGHEQALYIAITGAAAAGSDQLYSLLVNQFRYTDGDTQWIECGYEAIPPKLQRLEPLCKYLTQFPWEPAVKNCIASLLKSGWQLKELTHALLTYIVYNSLGCFTMGNGISKEIDLSDSGESQNTSFIVQNTPPRRPSDDGSDMIQVISFLKEQTLKEELERQQQKQQQIYAPALVQFVQEEVEIDEQQQKKLNEKFLKHFEAANKVQESPGFQILRSSEYSFSINAYPLLKELAPEPIEAAYRFLKLIKTMTRQSFAQEQSISTLAFRKAILAYAENIYRYQYDDINYSEQMNKLLPRELKLFIKLVSQSPSNLSKQHIDNIKLRLNPDELCHITLLTIAGKLETQMIYLSKAVLEFM